MAVAAGVVIVAITNSSSDDLEEQSPDLESRCNGAEIYDPILAAAGVEGEVVGTVVIRVQGDLRNFDVTVIGSAVGCIPVCFWIEDTSGDEDIDMEEIKFIREYSEYGEAKNFALYVFPQAGGGTEFAAVFRDPTTLAAPIPVFEGFPILDLAVYPHGTENVEITFASSLADAAEVRVGPGQDDCFIYNSSDEIIG